jgi:RNA polymerase sigma-70 factor (ECF subfamily)
MPDTSKPNRSDKQLIADYLKGDETALGVLIKQYLRPIYGFVYRYVGNTGASEDITQEVFVRMWRNIKKFNPEKNFKTWIFAIAKNASIDFLKKKKALPFSEFDNEEGDNIIENILIDAELLPSEILEREDAARVLNEALEKLSPKYRTVLFLYYNENFNFREIAEILGEPLDTVKSRHRRALAVLKKILVELA